MFLGIIVVLLVLFLVFVVWILLAEISIVADTYRNEYHVSFGGISKAELIPLPGDLLIRLHFAFWEKDLYPLHPSVGKEKKKPEPDRKSKKGFPFRRIIKVLKSFHIKYFQLEVDTEDFIWNAYLWPVVYGVKPLRRHVYVNFQGRNECRLLIHNRIWRMAWAWLSG